MATPCPLASSHCETVAIFVGIVFFCEFLCYKVLKKCGLVEVCLKFYIFYFVCTIALHREGVYG